MNAMRYLSLFIFLLLLGCVPKEKEKTTSTSMPDTSVVVAEGQKIAKAAFGTLSSNLGKAMAEGGVPHALQFCNVEAMPLTDSLSSSYGLQLERVSHRPRNPDNRADSLEMATIKQYLSNIEQGKQIQPAVYKLEDKIAYHAPIRITNDLCLNCHGRVGTDITGQSIKVLQELYPEDEATGFEMGDLRGIWAIEFPRSYFDK